MHADDIISGLSGRGNSTGDVPKVLRLCTGPHLLSYVNPCGQVKQHTEPADAADFSLFASYWQASRVLS
jgi:hypothetical protein